ncbi:MAG TPA: hypothetical protein VGJ94_00905 [Syntrophorhabdaceae bacterium]|jgi:hypothetical protein
MKKVVCMQLGIFLLIFALSFPINPSLATSVPPEGLPDTYKALADIRAKDVYPGESIKHALVGAVFPKGVEAMALKFSNVTAAFYGTSLFQAGKQWGWKNIDPLSKAIFRQIGQAKTAEALEMGIDLPKDSRAPGLVFITAVFTSSPEYNFEFIKYTPEETVVRIFGADRYYRAAKALAIESYLTWPVLSPFFEGIAEKMGIKCIISMKVNRLEKDGTCDFMAKFTMESGRGK